MSTKNSPKNFDSIKQSDESLQTTIKFSYASLAVFCGMMMIFVFDMMNRSDQISFIPLFFSILMGMAAADFFSGLLHWLFDTWGSSDSLFWGEYIVKSFREHHTRPHLILKRNWIESNGVPIMVVVSVHIVYTIFIEDRLIPISQSVHMSMFLFCFYFMMAVSNEIHKLCHYPKKCGYFVETLRFFKIIPSVADHKKHHTFPFDDNYCLATGWMNPILRKIEFWRRLEKLITMLTGMKPRQEDHLYYEVLVKKSARNKNEIRQRIKE